MQLMTKRFRTLLLGCGWMLTALMPALRAEDGNREILPLDREWQGISTYAVSIAPFPENPKWQEIELPRFKGGESLLLRREIAVPAHWEGRKIFLRGEFCNYRTTVFVDGNSAGEHTGGFGVFEMDLSGVLQPGKTHELRVTITGPQLSAENKFPDALSYGQSWSWGASHLELAALPAEAIRSFQLQPDAEKNRLKVTGTMDGRASGTLKILDAEGNVKKTAAFSPEEDGSFSVEVDCTGLRHWSPDDPYLYTVQLALTGKDGQSGDTVTEKMGLRTFRIVGDKFYLNGKRLNLQGDGWHSRHNWSDKQIVELFTALKAAGVNIYRGHGPHPRNLYRIADRMGMLLVGEGPIHQFYRDDYRHPDYRKNAEKSYREWVEMIRNHPSLVIYSVDNEVINGEGGYQDDKRIAADQERKTVLFAMADVIRNADPTRPLMFEGDGAMDGVADIVNMHYPHELPFWPVIPRDTLWVRDDPESCNWKYAAPDGKKPLYIGEFGKYFDFSPRSLAIVAGDSAYYSFDAYYKACGELVKQAIIGLRRCGVAGISPWNTSTYGIIWRNGEFQGGNGLYDGIREAFKPETVFPVQLPSRAYRTQMVEAKFELFNNSGHNREYQLKINAETFALPVGAGESVPVAVTIPAGTETVELLLTANGREIEKKHFRIAQSDPVPPPKQLIYLIDDPAGRTSGALDGIKFPFRRITSPAALPDRALCLIGEGALKQNEAELTAAAERGCRIIILAQRELPQECFGLHLEKAETSFVFPRDLAGFAQDAFWNYRPDGLAATHLIRKPDDARFRVRMDSASNLFGLKFAVVLEREFASGGAVIFCQLPLLENLPHDPAAAKLLAALASEQRPKIATAELRFADPRLEKMARDSHLPTQTSAAAGQWNDAVRLIVADGKSFASGDETQWRKFFDRGGRLLMFEPTPEALARLAAFSGCALTLEPQTAYHLELLDRKSFPGVSNEEFAWVVYDEWGSEYRGSGDRKWPIVKSILRYPEEAQVRELLRTKPLMPRRGEYGDSIRTAVELQDFSFDTDNECAGALLPVGAGSATVLTLNFAELYNTEPDLVQKGANDRWETTNFSLDSMMRRILGGALRGLREMN